MIDYPDFSGQGERPCLKADPNIFTGEMDFPRTLKARLLTEEAKQVCAECPYQVICGRFALDHFDDDTVRGVYGGLSEEDRRNIMKTRKVGAKVSAYS